jgi:hypothetical protein
MSDLLLRTSCIRGRPQNATLLNCFHNGNRIDHYIQLSAIIVIHEKHFAKSHFKTGIKFLKLLGRYCNLPQNLFYIPDELNRLKDEITDYYLDLYYFKSNNRSFRHKKEKI